MERINKILAIAIEEYDDMNLNKLKNCKKDLTDILKILTTKYIFDAPDFIFKKTDTTRKGLLLTLSDYFINRLNDENVLLLFAGHGEYNDKSKMPYWLPSDADATDFSSWVSMTEVLSFIKASSAHHVSIITDSCFSGALLEAGNRSGGFEVIANKKSRQILSSGGIEKVSDGNPGDNSPFAKTVLNILRENNDKELPFISFALQVVTKFDKKHTQKPIYGDLNNLGHESGSFVFELFSANSDVFTKETLKKEMGNVYIALPDFAIVDLELLKKIHKEKSEIVQLQLYERAAALRDKERKLEQQLNERLVKNLIEESKSQNRSEEKIKVENAIARSYDEYKKNIEDVSRYKKKKSIRQKHELHYGLGVYQNPIFDLFKSEEDALFCAYRKNLKSLLHTTLDIIGNLENPHVAFIFDDLREIVKDVYHFEIKTLKGFPPSEIDLEIFKKEIEIKCLNWIRGGYLFLKT